MLFSLIEGVDLVFQNRRYVVVALVVTFNLLFVCLLAPVIHAYGANLATHMQTANASQSVQEVSESPNVLTDALSQMAGDASHAENTVELDVVTGVLKLASDITHFDRDIMHGSYIAIDFTLHIVATCVSGIGSAVRWSIVSMWHVLGDSCRWSFKFTGHIIGDSTGLFRVLAHPSSIIRPADHTPAPTITQLQAEQAAIIQKGTVAVAIPAEIVSTGGACDDGNGNGGYPMTWCNAPMDSIATIAYSSDPINRECTSYAYWYFTFVEGNSGFRVWGNAKYWAATSNYPTHVKPVDGAIAVETAGAYGHVAIVQALPGEEYAGKTVPAGYVLVSEMNYDWDGHFRYSYSPLTKFSAYIYPES